MAGRTGSVKKVWSAIVPENIARAAYDCASHPFAPAGSNPLELFVLSSCAVIALNVADAAPVGGSAVVASVTGATRASAFVIGCTIGSSASIVAGAEVTDPIGLMLTFTAYPYSVYNNH